MSFYIRIALAVLGLGALAAAGAWVLNTVHKAAEVDRYHECTTAVKKGGDLSSCDLEVAHDVEAARQADFCDRAIGDHNAYQIGMACPTSIKTLDGQLTAAGANLTDTQQQLAQARQALAGAVSRAESRAASQATRKADNDRTIQALPRADDGTVACDADCLRRLASGAPTRP